MCWRCCKQEARAEGQAGQPRRLQRHHQAVRARRDGQSAPDRRAAGRRLSGPPRARLSRRLHAVAGAVAQAAGRPLGRPRAVGGAAARLRPRGRDRALHPRGILADRRAPGDAARRRVSRRASPASKARGCRSSTSPTQAQADDIKAMLEGATFRVAVGRGQADQAQSRPALHHLDPAAGGLVASSASRPTRTMQIAQRLYEGIDIGGETAGLITYMRTDGVQMAPEAIDAARARDRQGVRRADTCRRSRAIYSTKAKNAQEAHEAIRPTDFFAHARRRCAQYLDADQARLYELIWKRAIASQMQPAEIERTTVEIEAVNGGRTARLARRRLGDPLRRLHRRLHRPEGRRRRGRGRPPPAGDPRRRDAGARDRSTPTQHHRAAAALFRSDADQEDGRARHRPALDLHRDPEDAARTANMSTIDKRRLIPQAKGRLLSAFLESFFETLCRIRLHRRPGGEARRDLRRQARLEGRAARFLDATSPAPSTTSRNCASPTCSTR